MGAKDKPISKPMSKLYAENYDNIFNKHPLGEDVRPKDAIKRGLSSACVEEEWDCTKKTDPHDDF